MQAHSCDAMTQRYAKDYVVYWVPHYRSPMTFIPKIHSWNPSAGSTTCGMTGTPLRGGVVLSPYGKVFHLGPAEDITCRTCSGSRKFHNRWWHSSDGTLQEKLAANSWVLITRYITFYDEDKTRFRRRYHVIRDKTGLVIGTGDTRERAYREAVRFR